MPRKKTTAIATTWGGLPAGSRVFVDTAPFIYVLESHLQFAELFVGLFEAAENGTLSIVLSTVTLAEVLTGPHKAGQTALAKRYVDAVAIVFDAEGAVFALGDGSVRFESGERADIHDGAVLCAALHPSGDGVVTGGDDGKVIWSMGITVNTRMFCKVEMSTPSADGTIKVNTAKLETAMADLDSVKGIGPGLATKMLDERKQRGSGGHGRRAPARRSRSHHLDPGRDNAGIMSELRAGPSSWAGRLGIGRLEKPHPMGLSWRTDRERGPRADQ